MVAGQLRHDCRQVSTGRVTAHGKAARVAADLDGVLVHPLEGGPAILDRGRVGVLGRQPVVHRDHHGIGLYRRGAGHRVVGVQVADDPSAAMDQHENRPYSALGGRVDPNRYFAGGARDRAIFDVGHLDPRRARRGDRPIRIPGGLRPVR